MAMGEGSEGCAGEGELDRRQGADHASQGMRARGRGPRLGRARVGRGRDQGHGAGRPATPSSQGAAPTGASRARAGVRAPRRRGRGAGGTRCYPLQTLEIKENEEQEWRTSPGKKTLARAEDKSVDCQRFGGPISEPDTQRRSPRRDKRSGTLNSADDAHIESNCSLELSS
jgi:hypothetical protein